MTTRDVVQEERAWLRTQHDYVTDHMRALAEHHARWGGDDAADLLEMASALLDVYRDDIQRLTAKLAPNGTVH